MRRRGLQVSKATDLDSQGAAVLGRKKSEKKVEVVQEKRVRLSIDIDPWDYRRLLSWCQDIAPAVGRVRVNHVWIIRALVKELWEDRELQVRVIDRVREENPK